LPFDSCAAVTASWWCDRSPGDEGEGRESEEKKSDRIGRRARAEVLAAILCRVRDGYDVRKNIDSFDSVDIL